MTGSCKLTALSALTVSRHQIPAYGLTPNTSLQKRPLLVYHAAFSSSEKSIVSQVQRHVSTVGVVKSAWVYSMYPFSHFHSTSHEVLCIASGAAVCCFGCEENPHKVELELQKGDVVVIPAGVGHRLMRETKSGFQMVGCYPTGCDWDMCYGKEEERSKIDKIKDLQWFKRDPIYGDQGPTLEASDA